MRRLLTYLTEDCCQGRPELCGAAFVTSAMSVGLYIAAAYWFTASTSFANPAVTIARSLTDTFAGIRPWDVAPFVLAQLTGALSALCVCHWLLGERTEA